jgi:hypothetical protein
MAKILTLSIILLITLTNSGCSSGALSLLTGGGPNVAANTQVGKENYQGVTTNVITKPELRPEGPVDTAIQDNSTNTNIPFWFLVLFALGWLAPSPQEISRGIYNLIHVIRGKK